MLNASVFFPHTYIRTYKNYFFILQNDKQKENRNAEDLLFGIMANSDTHNRVEVEAVTM